LYVRRAARTQTLATPTTIGPQSHKATETASFGGRREAPRTAGAIGKNESQWI